MEDDQVFRYQYSAKQNKEVESIRKKYVSEEVSKMDMLKELDHRVQTAGRLPALIIGAIGCLVFGIGMCFGLDVFAGADRLTILFCIAGAIIMVTAYPIYRHIAGKTKTELLPDILRLSEEIVKI